LLGYRRADQASVVGSFGRTGQEMAILLSTGIDSDGQQLFVVDKTGRISDLTGGAVAGTGGAIIDSGRRTFGRPDGRLYAGYALQPVVAFHRRAGVRRSEFGEGRGNSSTRRTSVTPDGRIFVVIRGNDRISIFDRDRNFRQLQRQGSEQGIFAAAGE
jgi:hypothetical protein